MTNFYFLTTSNTRKMFKGKKEDVLARKAGDPDKYKRKLQPNKKVLLPKEVAEQQAKKNGHGQVHHPPLSALPTPEEREARRLAAEKAEKEKRLAEFADQRKQMVAKQNVNSYNRKNGDVTDHPGGTGRH